MAIFSSCDKLMTEFFVPASKQITVQFSLTKFVCCLVINFIFVNNPEVNTNSLNTLSISKKRNAMLKQRTI